MKIRLNDQAADQLTWIMEKMGYTSPTHLMQVMLSSTYNKLNRNPNKHKSPSEDSHGNQSSKRM